MGGEPDRPAQDRDDDAELRQIDALNRLRTGPAGPDEQEPEAPDGAEPAPTRPRRTHP